jgi:hypothetical protein
MNDFDEMCNVTTFAAKKKTLDGWLESSPGVKLKLDKTHRPECKHNT